MFSMRLFVALHPSLEAAEHLEDFLEARVGADPDLRWSPPAQWHVTLAFMGAAPERVVDDLVDNLTAVAARSAPPSLRITGGGCFPDVTAALVLWAGLTGVEALAPLARSVRNAATVVGAAPEGGPIRAPHRGDAVGPGPGLLRRSRVDGIRDHGHLVAPAPKPRAPTSP